MPEFSEIAAFFTRHYMMCGAWIVVLILLIVFQFKIMVARVKKTTANMAIQMVNKQEGLFVDVRTVDNFKQGHIANSINVTALEIKEGKLQRIEKNRNKPVILVGKDKFDTDTFNSARLLKKNGFSQIYVLSGGIMEWSSDNLPLSVK